MKLRLFALLTVAALSACTNSYPEEELVFNPDYNRIARNVTVVSKSPKYVTYEYKNSQSICYIGRIGIYCKLSKAAFGNFPAYEGRAAGIVAV